MKTSFLRLSPMAAAVLAALAGLLLATDRVEAHAFLDHAEPAVGGTVQQVPTEVAITFNEPLEPKFSRVKVSDASGNEVDRKDVHLDLKNPRRLIVSLPPGLSPGRYQVNWHAVSKDTHKTEGEYTFTVSS